ncbi:hypothetical protein ACFLZ6_01165 [Nanoarchaeota archaeon]
MKEQKRTPWGLIIFVLILLFLLSSVFAGLISLSTDIGVEFLPGNVALIPVKGVIRADAVSSWTEETASSTDIVDFIEKADNNPKIQAIILDINSPGGSANQMVANAKTLEEAEQRKTEFLEGPARLKKSYVTGLGSILETSPASIGNTTINLRDTQAQFKLIYLRILEDIAA